jgi:hypothetical protein
MLPLLLVRPQAGGALDGRMLHGSITTTTTRNAAGAITATATPLWRILDLAWPTSNTATTSTIIT